MSPSESILVSHRQICHLISTGWRDFWQDSRNQGLNPGEGASPDSFFPSFRPAVAQLTNRGEQKGCFRKTKTSPTTNSMNPSSRRCGRVAGLLIPLVLALTWLTLAPKAWAQCPQSCNDITLNTALGVGALVSENGGTYDTAVGFAALYNNTIGNYNTASGFEALVTNTTGINNTANGAGALFNNTIGINNTATGADALQSNTMGNANTANGVQALVTNSTGGSNTASGYLALFSNTTGANNTAIGVNALLLNTTGFANAATGNGALLNNTTANFNTANGFQALYNNTTGASNIALGASGGGNLTTGSNNIDIGNLGVAGDFGAIRIGVKTTHRATLIAGISGASVPTGVAVIVDRNGHLGTTTSSARFKDAIKAMDKASEAILALKPVTFHYKHELDPDGVPQFGLVAEQVEKVNPDLVARDDQGKPYTVRYEAVNAMLLNEFIKEHRTVQELKKEIAALTATVQKVSAQVEMSRPAPQTVLDNR